MARSLDVLNSVTIDTTCSAPWSAHRAISEHDVVGEDPIATFRSVRSPDPDSRSGPVLGAFKVHSAASPSGNSRHLFPQSARQAQCPESTERLWLGQLDLAEQDGAAFLLRV